MLSLAQIMIIVIQQSKINRKLSFDNPPNFADGGDETWGGNVEEATWGGSPPKKLLNFIFYFLVKKVKTKFLPNPSPPLGGGGARGGGKGASHVIKR